MEKLSLLGPFMGLSVFAEDNVSIDSNFLLLWHNANELINVFSDNVLQIYKLSITLVININKLI